MSCHWNSKLRIYTIAMLPFVRDCHWSPNKWHMADCVISSTKYFILYRKLVKPLTIFFTFTNFCHVLPFSKYVNSHKNSFILITNDVGDVKIQYCTLLALKRPSHFVNQITTLCVCMLHVCIYN